MHATLAAWNNFYLITGTAAAALTGLQFVVQTLLASNMIRATTGSDPEGGIAAFGTPTVVHLSLALLISAVLCAPWTEYEGLRAIIGALGAGALIYSGVVLRRARRQRSYAPTAYDWVWHILLPAIANALVLAAAVSMSDTASAPYFMLATATLLLICVGIHNAWDTVTYLTVNAVRMSHAQEKPVSAQRSAPAQRSKKRR